MKIDVIYVACYRRDFRLTCALVASIRHWYPDIRIELLKDENMLAFDTSRLERIYNVHLFQCPDKVFGMGFYKFEPLFRDEGKRALFLDSDIILTGPVIETLEQYDEDFIVVNEEDTDENRNSYYFNLEDVTSFDPSFKYPGFTFNTGQFVATCGKLRREDFDGLVSWTTPRQVLRRDVFKYHGEQPILNYVVLKRFSEGSLSVRRVDFMRESMHPDAAAVSVQRVMNKEGYPFLIHWHDAKPKVMMPSMKLIARNDLIRYFEDLYYRTAGIGRMRQTISRYTIYFLDELFLASVYVYGHLKKIMGRS